MTLVRGRDAAVGVEHSDGVSAGGSVGTYAPYPLISFDHKVDAIPLEESDELIAQGSRETVPPSQRQVIGTMVLRPRFDDPQFLKILCNAMGGTETRAVSQDIYGYTGAHTGCNAHVVEAGGLQPRQWLRMNLGAAGLRIDSTCKFSKMVWEHAAGSTPRLSVDVLGIGPSAGTAAALALHTGVLPMRATSMEGTGIVALGSGDPHITWGPLGTSGYIALSNVTLFRVTLDHQMIQSSAYVNSALSFAELAGGDKTRSVEVELEGEMPDSKVPSTPQTHPYYSYAAGQTPFSLDAVYSAKDAALGAGLISHGIRLSLPNVFPTEGSLAVAGPGILKWTVKGIAVMSDNYYPTDWDVPAAGIDFRVLFNVAPADEVANNTGSYFCHQHA